MIGHRKERVGIVVTDNMDKSIKIKSERLMLHPLYGKIIKKFKNYMVHDEKNEAHVGDKVLIRETKPISKRKCWKLVEILQKAHG